jgi:hypothetical protein
VRPWLQTLHFFFAVGALISPLLVNLVLQYTAEFDWSFYR